MALLPIVFAVILVLVAIFYFGFNRSSRKRNGTRLPGPRGLPFVGSVFSVKRRLYESFSELTKIYGNIFNVNLLGNDIVVISDHHLAREAYNNPSLLARPHFPVLDVISNGGRGVIGTNGQQWVDQRRFTLRHLREFGFRKNAMEDLIIDEVRDFIDWLKSVEGAPTMLEHKFNLATVSSLWKIMTGSRVKQDDPKLQDILGSLQKGLQKLGSSPIGFFFPKLAQAFPKLSGWADFTNGLNALLEFMRESISEHRATLSSDFERDFVDAYLKEIRSTADPKSSFYGEDGGCKGRVRSLEAVMIDVFNAGAEPISHTLSWSILYLTSFPEKLQKLQKEIEAAVGNTRLPSLSDRERLPFAEAVVNETLRMSSLAALGAFHCASQNTTIAEFDIPEGSWICLNQYHVNHDPEIWGDPENFRPERFLSEDGKSVKKNEALVPFSVGKRMCLGESLARDEIFLFLTSIVQRFTIELDPNSPKLISLQSPCSDFLFPPKYKVIFKDRNTL